MSGFFGIVNTDGAPVDLALVRDMAAALLVCGPDRQDTWQEGHVALGHALLRSSFDCPREELPCSLEGEVWIVSDARIDGRAELIGKLRAKGRADVTAESNDALLILHAYHAWGEKCVQHLIGDFAFAIWDGRSRQLFCARDQFGLVPFYYAETAGALVVSNTVGSLRRHPGISSELNEQAIGDFLLYNLNMSVDTTTAFRDIHSLAPAHTMTWKDGKVRRERYWEMPQDQAYKCSKRPEEWIEGFSAVFEQAIGDRLRSDSAGLHLSGGMDSGSIAAVANKVLRARHQNPDLRAYNIVYESLVREEEGPYSDLTAQYLGIPIQRFVAEEYLLREPDPAPAWISSSPCTIVNQVPEAEISQRIAGFSRTLLTGFGGDPLFTVQGAFTGAAFVPWHLPHAARDHYAAFRLYGRLPRPQVRRALRARFGKPASLPPLPHWLNPEFAKRANLTERAQQLQRNTPIYRSAQGLTGPLWGNLFAWGHPGSSGIAVKTLFPFFDTRLVTCVQTVPPLSLRQGKRILRESMRGLMPDEVRTRPKTLLYRTSANPGSEDLGPHDKLARLPEVQRWRREMVATPLLATYVDVKLAHAAIDAPAPARDGTPLNSCIALAFWLQSPR
jgi:asparagine synthase (glutamine-hydrolysing)